MKKIYIIKTGDTLSDIADRFSDFEDWIIRGLKVDPSEVTVFDAVNNRDLPEIDRIKSAVIAGSHAMVTENLPWSLNIEDWIPGIIENHIPLLGICYGHQLIAKAMGGVIAYHPGGMELGTKEITLFESSRKDPLFDGFPERMNVHVSHSQTVATLPPGAVLLAGNNFEPHHAFRIGKNTWGVQFHPEYDTLIMQAYISQSAKLFGEISAIEATLLEEVKETPFAADMLERFGRIA